MDELAPYEKVRVHSVDPIRTRWLAVDRRSGRSVWIDSVPRPPHVPEFILRATLTQASNLHHPHIIDILDAGLTRDESFFVYPEERSRRLDELIELGPSEHHQLVEFGLSSNMGRVQFLVHVALAVAYAHEHGVRHGRLLANQIVMRPCGQPVITGFGLCEALPRHEVFRSSASTSAGTPPLQAVDIHALGLLLESILALPIVPSTLSSRQDKRDRKFDSSMRRILSAALRENPDSSYMTADALASDLRCWLRGEPVSVDPQPWYLPLLAHALRHPVAASLLAVVCLGLLVASSILGRTIADWPRIEDARRAAVAKHAADHVASGFDAFAAGSLAVADQNFRTAREIAQSPEAHLGTALVLRATQGPEAAVDYLERNSPRSASGDGRSILQWELTNASEERGEPMPPAPTTALDHIALAVVTESPFTGESRILQSLHSAENAALMSGATRQAALAILIRMAGHDPHWISEVESLIRDLFLDNSPLLGAFLAALIDRPGALDIATRLMERSNLDRRTRLAACTVFIKSKDPAHHAIAHQQLESLGIRLEDVTDESPEAIKLRFLAAERDDRIHDAIRLAELMRSQNSEDINLDLKLGRLYLRSDQPARALEIANAALRTIPEARQFRFLRLASLDRMGRSDTLKEAEAIRSEWPTAIGPRAILGRQRWLNGQHESGMQALASAIAWDPTSLPAYMDLTFALLELNRGAEAQAWIRATPAPSSSNRVMHQIHRARAAAQVGARELAEREIADAKPINAEELPLRRNRGLVLSRDLGRYAEAIPDLEIALADDPEHREVRFQLGDALYHRGLYERSAEVLEPFSEGKTSYARGTSRYVDALVKLKRSEQALSTLRAAIIQHPRNPELHLRLAKAIPKPEGAADAVESYRIYLDAFPDNAEAWCNLGLAYESLRNYPESVRALRRGHALGTRRTSWPYPSRAWLTRCEAARGP